MQVNNNGPVFGQTNIDNSITLAQADLRVGLEQLKLLIGAGVLPESVGREVVGDMEAGLAQTGERAKNRLQVAGRRLREWVAIGGASADDVNKIWAVIAAISAAVGS
ncbi:hypothetical protein [Planotetraspora mira]|uniref:Uncharacterized protein n=1 Tax=Planotetraspora mira TaxID=58121 RepID=A0A8J3TSL9_9ACTN|nr:hypothetical protein [Planotetraspora mira]GII32305.1 hypothetical protein Pmi06nite_57470 [Planotetraspora mira]